jgi:hypothetical protein
MLLTLEDRASLRKLRLYACAWGYSVWDRLTDERSRQAILTAERFACSLQLSEQDRTALLGACPAHELATLQRLLFRLGQFGLPEAQ